MRKCVSTLVYVVACFVVGKAVIAFENGIGVKFPNPTWIWSTLDKLVVTILLFAIVVINKLLQMWSED